VLNLVRARHIAGGIRCLWVERLSVGVSSIVLRPVGIAELSSREHPARWRPMAGARAQTIPLDHPAALPSFAVLKRLAGWRC